MYTLGGWVAAFTLPPSPSGSGRRTRRTCSDSRPGGGCSRPRTRSSRRRRPALSIPFPRESVQQVPGTGFESDLAVVEGVAPERAAPHRRPGVAPPLDIGHDPPRGISSLREHAANSQTSSRSAPCQPAARWYTIGQIDQPAAFAVDRNAVGSCSRKVRRGRTRSASSVRRTHLRVPAAEDTAVCGRETVVAGAEPDAPLLRPRPAPPRGRRSRR